MTQREGVGVGGLMNNGLRVWPDEGVQEASHNHHGDAFTGEEAPAHVGETPRTRDEPHPQLVGRSQSVHHAETMQMFQDSIWGHLIC